MIGPALPAKGGAVMRLVAYFRSLGAKLFRRLETEAEIEEELLSHIENRADDLEGAGMDRAEAERRARIEFGSRVRFHEEAREALGGNFIDTLWNDVKYGARVLRKSPGFTTIALGTLALAIGANAVVFGVLNGLILLPLDVPHPESLWGIEHRTEHNMYESYPDYRDLRDRNRSFDGLAGFSIDQVGFDSGQEVSHAWINLVTGNYFDVLRLQPYLGRLFHAADERGAGSAPYVVLNYAYWHNHFRDDAGVIGRTVQVNKHPFTVIGVAPPGFHGVLAFGIPDFYVPMANQEQVEGKNALETRGSQTVFMTFGHLKPGVSPQQAVADLNSIGTYLERTYPKEHGPTRFVLARPNLYGNLMGGPMRAFVSALMLLAGLILLAACANLGSLFGARAADRAREVALRLALGASRGRVLRQLLTEAMLISLAGGALGLWGSVALLSQLTAWQPFPKFPIVVPVSPDASVYAISLLLALVSGLLFGVVPVRQVMRADAYQVVKAGSSGGGRRMTIREVLLGVQIAICAVLVTSSMVAFRGLGRSLHSNFGFDPRNVMLAETNLSMAGYRDDESPAMQKRMVDAVASVAAVESAGLISRTPLYGGGFTSAVYTDQTMDMQPSNAAAVAERFHISPEYFRAAGTALLAGRPFSWHDDKDSPRVAIVNREFARRLFGSATSALGGRFKLRSEVRLEIVGVVEDGKYYSLTEDPTPAMFIPVTQDPIGESCLVVRSERDPEQLAGAIRAALREVDPGLPLYIESWNQEMALALFPSRIATLSLGVLGGMGAMLALTGIFGMAAYSVSRRLKELGIRMAIGAHPRDVLQTALGRAFKLLAIGSAAGLALGILASRVLASIVYQASPRDPLVLTSVVLAMLLTGVSATWIPARRVLSIDPLTLLRDE